MATTPTTEPVTLIAGDTLAWRREDLTGDYPASGGWALAYRLVNAAGKIDIAAAADGAAFAVSVPAATTASYAPGDYTWVATVTKAGERHTIDTGRITVRADLASAATADTRSSARKALDAADAALEAYGAKAYLQTFAVAGRQQTFHSPGDFLAYRSRLQAEVARETNAERLAQGLAPRNKLLVRFRR